MSGEQNAAADDESAAAKTGAKRSRIPLVLAGLAVAGLGAAALTLYGPPGWLAGAAEAGAEHAAAERPAVYFTLAEDLIVNFDSGGRIRYLQLGIDLMTREPEAVEALEMHAPVLRNNLIMLLSDRSYEELMTRKGKEALQRDALAEVQAVMTERHGSAAVETLYFTSFVMQ